MIKETPKKVPLTALDAVKGTDLSGKVFVITGAYSGLGAATTIALLTAGAKVVVAGRSSKSQQAFVNELTTSKHGFNLDLIDASQTVDLGSLASVRAFADLIIANYEVVECLINNAGVMKTPPGLTIDGFETQMGTNVIGHFLLAKLLVDITKRQVWLSSTGHALIGDPPGNHDYGKAPRIDLDAIKNVDKSTYDSWSRYQQSKLGDILLAKQFPVEYEHLKACAVHPGVVRTNLGRGLSIWMILRFVISGLFGGGQPAVSPEQGARTQTLCAVMPEDELISGAYYVDCVVSEEAVSARNMEDAKKLFDFCDLATKSFQKLP